MADSSNVDAAIVAALKADTALAALMTDGVFVDVGPGGAERLVIVSLLAHEDVYVFEGGAWEQCTYLVKAVARATSGVDLKAAAARIQAVLQDVPLTITGYSHMLTRRAERIRYTEVADDDRDMRWQHRGGQYEVWVSPS